jgi:hypothetical protein
MADFPVFGSGNRTAPYFQKEQFPNIELETNVSSPPNSPKTVVVKISIVNLSTNLVTATLDRIFQYSWETASNELTVASIAVETGTAADMHFSIDITKATSQSFTTPSIPGGISTPIYTITKTANIDILIENLQVPSLASTFERIKAYMSAAVANDLNP